MELLVEEIFTLTEERDGYLLHSNDKEKLNLIKQYSNEELFEYKIRFKDKSTNTMSDKEIIADYKKRNYGKLIRKFSSLLRELSLFEDEPRIREIFYINDEIGFFSIYIQYNENIKMNELTLMINREKINNKKEFKEILLFIKYLCTEYDVCLNEFFIKLDEKILIYK